MMGFQWRHTLSAALLGLAVTARAEDADDSALRLADETPVVEEKARDWRSFVEAALGASSRRSDGDTRDVERLSLDVQYEHNLSGGTRLLLSDRLDANWPAPASGERVINTLKEAYGSWRWQTDTMLDLGRINVRHGVATGYNPTDYFRGGALRSITSISPGSLKENRQGSIMLRTQKLWEGGAITALYSPELEHRANSEGFSLDVGATNNRHRGLVAISQKFGQSFTPQFLLYREAGQDTQFGLNLTSLLNDATVAHFEWSGGRGPSQLTQALGTLLPPCDCNSWRNDISTGVTYTTPSKITLTLEAHYNGGGATRTQWDALRQGSPLAYGLYRSWVQSAQELPTRRELFLFALWQDAFTDRLDLSMMTNFDVTDSSRRDWLEARYHRGRIDYALQWQNNGGTHLSNFGALPESRAWQISLRYYL